MDKILDSVQSPPKATKDGVSTPDDGDSKPLPKGVVLGKDGKPCRTCTSVSQWSALIKSAEAGNTPTKSTSKPPPSQAAQTTPEPRSDCPADVETLGRSTWTFLHTLTATYPSNASSQQQKEMKQFLSLFGKWYPCWVCAEDFQSWMSKPENEPKLETRGRFGDWMCQAHNEVNKKLGKKEFDCSKWEERWRSGWKDGSCD